MFVVLIVCALFGGSHVAESAARYSGRIVGGQAAKIENFKWQAALLENSKFFCGGSIISPTKILTAAHCTDNLIYHNKLEARVGSSSSTEGGIVKSIIKIRMHPDYNSPTRLNNDIAVFFLGESLVFGPTIGGIPIAGSSVSLPPNTVVIVSGFGVTTPSTTEWGVLHSVSVPIVDHDICAKAYKNYKGKAKLTNNMICAGYYGTGGKDACKGDSGGPLVYSSGSSSTILYGVVSWGGGSTCGDPNFPGIYAKVSVYRDWINNVS